MSNSRKTILSTIIATALALGSVSAYARHHDKTPSAEEVSALNSATVTANQALDAATKKVAGDAVKVEFDLEDGKSVYEVDVFNNKNERYEVTVDAKSGEVLDSHLDERKEHHGKKHDRKGHHDKDGFKGDKSSAKAQNGEQTPPAPPADGARPKPAKPAVSLQKAIDTAVAKTGGKVEFAGFRPRGDKAVYGVGTVVDGKMQFTFVDANSGEIVDAPVKKQ